MVIQERNKLRELLASMALQCRCWFRFSGGKANLLYRPDTLTSDKTITAGMTAMNEDYTTTRTIRRSPLDEVINIIHLYYKRDWNISAGQSAYQAVLRDTAPVSILAYGEKEKASLFMFDYVRDDAMAADVLAFFLARYAYRKQDIRQVVFMDNSELEFADAVTLAALNNLLCEVLQVGPAPGSKDVADTINLMVREY